MNDNYSEYFMNRKPSPFSEKSIRFWHKRMLMIAAKWIPALHTKSILEIGVGHGFFAEVCQQKQITYQGLEMNAEQADLLKASGHDIIAVMVPPIPAGEAVQVIWLSHILEHAPSYVIAKEMLLACHERLDPEGYVVIIAPDCLHWKERFWSCDWSHGFPTSLTRVEQLLHETNFSVHRSMYHTLSLTNPVAAWSISTFFRWCLPVEILDYFFQRYTGHRFCQAFMGVFGLRQIYLIGKKRA